MQTIDISIWAWGALGAVVFVLLAVDLTAHRGAHVDSPKRAMIWTVVWISLALLFNLGVGLLFGAQAGWEFLSAYILEKSLSIDNLFVFLLIFGALKIPAAQQRRVLSWGIFGALITRGLFIAVGAAILQRWHAVIYIFGALLIYTAFKMLRESESHLGENKVLKFLGRFIPHTTKLDGSRFVIHEGGRRLATPLLFALIAVELTDVIFAVDSIPAAFAVSETPFIVYSSNVLAILGLRSLYVVLAGALADLKYLRYGLAAVLALAGGKMLASGWIHVPALVSLGLIVLAIGTSVVASLRARKTEPEALRIGALDPE